MALSTIFNSVIGQLGIPIFAQLPDSSQQEAVIFKLVKQIAFLTAPIYALLFLVIDPQVVTWVFGAKWVPICTVIPGLLVFAYFRVINTPLRTMLEAKGRPGVNAKANLYIAPIAVLAFVIGAHQGGIVGVSLAVAIVLGIGWTVQWWWIGCRALGWSLKKFLMPCFIPVLLIVPGIAIAFNLPLWLKPIAFSLAYLGCVRCLMPKQFFECQMLVNQLMQRLLNKRRHQ